MSDSGTQPSATGSPLGQAINGGDISGALAASQQNQDFLKKAALALPTALKASRDDEAAKSRPILDKINDLTEAEIAQIKGPPPQPKPTSVVEQWGSPAMLLAVIGSAFTRQPLTNALNAGAAVMKGFQQRDFDAAQTAFKNWKEANDTSLKLMGIQRESYADALKAIEHSGGEDRKDAMATFAALAHAFNDQPMMAAAAAGRWDIALGLAADRHSHYQKMDEGAKAAEKQYELQRAAFDSVTKLQATPPHSPDYAKAKADAESAATALKNWHDTQIGKGGETKPEKFGTIDDLMGRWHEDFVKPVAQGGKGREPTTDEIAAERQALQGQIKPTGGRTQQMAQRLMIGANEVNKALTALTKLPAGTTLGWFGGAQVAQGEDLAENVKKALANEVTPQSSQVLKALSNGVSRGLAILESGGSAQGLVGLSKQLQNDLPQQNDTGLTIAAKFADIRQIVEAATEVLETSELSKDQKVLIKNIAENIQKAVPFTTSDVAEMAANPTDETIAQFAHRIGLGKPPGPKIDEVHDGYRFKGGDPADHHNWEKTQ